MKNKYLNLPNRLLALADLFDGDRHLLPAESEHIKGLLLDMVNDAEVILKGTVSVPVVGKINSADLVIIKNTKPNFTLLTGGCDD